MEQEILTTLQEIRGMVLVIIAIFCIWVGTLIISVIIENFPFVKHRNIADKAEELFEQGKYKELTKLCKSVLSKRPNKTVAVYWLAKTKYSLGEYEEAANLFKKVMAIEPNWDIDYVQPFLDKIEEYENSANK